MVKINGNGNVLNRHILTIRYGTDIFIARWLEKSYKQHCTMEHTKDEKRDCSLQ